MAQEQTGEVIVLRIEGLEAGMLRELVDMANAHIDKALAEGVIRTPFTAEQLKEINTPDVVVKSMIRSLYMTKQQVIEGGEENE